MAHLATAFRIPSVVLFGPTAPSQSGPPFERTWHRVLWAGWTGDPRGSTIDSALLAITPRQVVTELDQLPNQASLPSPESRERVIAGR
jgi:ADP-heptose:LPS heptosyltransferase